jgi:type VI secretion system protein ImpM
MARFVYGKHPAFGDFVTAGLPGVAQDRLEAWLNGSLSALRVAWGEAWQDGFDDSPTIAFWIGARLTGDGALRGAMHPSQDKVGRRFPLIAGWAGPGPLPPSLDPSDHYAADVAALLADLAPDPAHGAQGIIDLLPDVAGEDVDADPAFWASRDDGDVAQLWADVAMADHLRAAHGRSYWWVVDDPTALYASDGLPPPVISQASASGGRPVGTADIAEAG